MISAMIFTFILIEFGYRISGHLSFVQDADYFTPSPIKGSPRIIKSNLNLPNLQTNSNHLRDREIPLNIPSGKFRIAIVGNSVTFGYHVSQEELYTELLEVRLNDHYKLHPAIDVINASQIGYNINHFQKFTEHFVFPYNPDMIVYQFCWNDIIRGGSSRNDILPSEIRKNFLKRMLLKHSGLYLQIYRLTNIEAFGWAVVNRYDDPDLLASFYRDLHAWVDEVRSRNLPFVMVIVPMGIEVEAAKRYPELANKFIYERKTIIENCRQIGIPIIDASGTLHDYFIQQQESLFLDQGHLNPIGHRVLADLLNDSLPAFIDTTLVR